MPERNDVSLPLGMTLLAALPILGCMLIMSAPALSDEHVLAFRLFYIVAYLIWVLPLGWIQRHLWARNAGWPLTIAVLLPLSYAMSVANALWALRFIASEKLRTHASWTWVFGGLDGCWLALIAFCGMQAIVLHRAALRQEESRHREAAQAARDAELRALRYQLQPHFLFNTLNAISALVNEERAREASRMIACLGEFLRTTLDESRGHEVTVADEIALADAYIDIEKARLGSRLHVDIHTGEGTLNAQIPCLLLQPLIENAIRHGIAHSPQPGRVSIRFAHRHPHVLLAVDNDIGPQQPDAGQGLGLANVRARLDTLYPDRSTLDARRVGQRWQVRITLPYVAATTVATEPR